MTNFLNTLVLIGLYLLSSCEAKKQATKHVEFHVYNPASGEGMQGVRVSIFRSNVKENELVWEGYTNSEGKASCIIEMKKYHKFDYYQYADTTEIGKNGNVNLPSYEDKMLGITWPSQLKFTYCFLQPKKFTIHFKNVSCTNENDQFRYREKRMYTPGATFWSSWSNYKVGCYENLTNYSELFNYTDTIIYEYEVERNNIINTYLDTFYISPYSVDTFKIYY